MRYGLLVLVVALVLPRPAGAAPFESPRTRVAYHVSAVEALAEHFALVLREPCPRFEAARQWRRYLEAEVDRAVLLLAHLEEAWREAKRTGDDSVRRAAKAPRDRVDEARELVEKLQTCAESNGTSLPLGSLWLRIEREVPRRQADIALPPPATP